jgi:hypothetical protein
MAQRPTRVCLISDECRPVDGKYEETILHCRQKGNWGNIIKTDLKAIESENQSRTIMSAGNRIMIWGSLGIL